MLAGIRFDWSSVSCFLRPQALLCEQIAPGYGVRFLFLASLYRAYALDGYFHHPNKQHFQFLSTVVRTATGLEFDVEHVPQCEQVLELLSVRTGSGSPVIAPANIRNVPYFASSAAVDQPHYFIVTGIDHTHNKVLIFDNLHLAPDNKSLEYGPNALPVNVFATLADNYWQTNVNRPGPTSAAESYWLLQIRPANDFVCQDESALSSLLISECLQHTRDLTEGRSHAHFDDRHLSRLESLCSAGSAADMKFGIRAWLADCNFAAVHLKIVIGILQGRNRDIAAELETHVQRYERAARARRMEMLVRCVTHGSPPPREWHCLRSDLSALAAALRLAVVTALGAISPRDVTMQR